MVTEAVRRIREARDTGATTLDLSSLQLRELPSQLARLTRLNLSGNLLTELPNWFSDMQALTHLARLFINSPRRCRRS